MNIANFFTATRMIAAPLFIMLYYLPRYVGISEQTVILILVPLFIYMEFTDFLDGYIARKRNLVTNFGKFMDPLADKLLVCAAMICMIPLSYLPAWYVIILISREFIISGFRLIAVEQNVVIAASYFGKFKTVSQMVMIILLILQIPALNLVTTGFVYLSLALTIISLIDYLYKNRSVLEEGGF